MRGRSGGMNPPPAEGGLASVFFFYYYSHATYLNEHIPIPPCHGVAGKPVRANYDSLIKSMLTHRLSCRKAVKYVWSSKKTTTGS